MSSVAAAPAKSLRQRIMNAGSWAIIGYGSVQVLRLVSSLVMTRLLAPELFGLMALTTAIGVVVSLLADIGIRQAVVQSKRGDSPEMLDTAWTMQIIRGVLIWLVCIVIAFVLDRLQVNGVLASDSVYGSPQLPMVIVAVTFSIVISGFASTKLLIADRSLDLRKASLIEVIGLVVTIICMATMAVWWKSVWPLVIGMTIGAVVNVWLSHAWLRGHRDRLRWDKDCVTEIIGIGRWILASSALHVLSFNGDRLMLGAWATQKQLAFYSIALTLAQAVELAAGRITISVATPAFSEVVRRDVNELPKVFWKLRIPMDLITLVVSGLFFGLGHVIIAILYDERYQAAGKILEILACSLIIARYNVSISAYIALGTTKYMPVINLVKLIALFVSMPLAYKFWGLEGAYWAIALHGASTIPLYYIYNRRHGLWSWSREFMLLLAWIPAWGLGLLIAKGASRWFGW